MKTSDNVNEIFSKLKPYLKDLKKLEERSPKNRISGKDMQNLYERHFGKARGSQLKFFFNYIGFIKIRIAGAKIWVREKTYVFTNRPDQHKS